MQENIRVRLRLLWQSRGVDTGEGTPERMEKVQGCDRNLPLRGVRETRGGNR